MKKKALKFKKSGWYAEELSARYISSICESSNLFVTVFKCAYNKCWTLRFVTKEGYELDSVTPNYLSTLWDIETKSELIKVLEQDIANMPSFFKDAEAEAIKLQKMMDDFNV